MKEEIIHIGELKIGNRENILKCTLGSCVGILFIWKEKERVGMAHCLLPEDTHPTGSERDHQPAKFVVSAISGLMKALKIMDEDISKIQVFVAGGANMISGLARKDQDHIGVLNQKKTLELLAQFNFKIHHRDLGGDCGRIMKVDCTNYEVTIEKIKKNKE